MNNTISTFITTLEAVKEAKGDLEIKVLFYTEDDQQEAAILDIDTITVSKVEMLGNSDENIKELVLFVVDVRNE